MFPHTITVWNQIASNHTGGHIYKSTVIHFVRYEHTLAKKSTKEGESNESNLKVFVFPSEIQCDSKYIDPESFKNLESKDSYYTFDLDTFIGIGEIDSDIPAGEHYCINSIYSPSDMSNDIHHFEIIGS